MIKQHLSANGVRTCYSDSQTGEFTLIFVHAFPFHQAMWRAQVEGLKDVVRVITYDVRGFGLSDGGYMPPTVPVYADDMLALMDTLDIERAVVCGLSMGGYIVLDAVARYPERFQALVLADTQCLADSEEGKAKRNETRKEIDTDGLEVFAEKFLNTALSRHAPGALLREAREIILDNRETTIKAALLAMADRKEHCSSLKDIRVPVLILCGEEDEVITVAQSELLFNSITGAEMHAIEKAGHLSNLEQPETFNLRIREFINRLAHK